MDSPSSPSTDCTETSADQKGPEPVPTQHRYQWPGAPWLQPSAVGAGGHQHPVLLAQWGPVLVLHPGQLLHTRVPARGLLLHTSAHGLLLHTCACTWAGLAHACVHTWAGLAHVCVCTWAGLAHVCTWAAPAHVCLCTLQLLHPCASLGQLPYVGLHTRVSSCSHLRLRAQGISQTHGTGWGGGELKAPLAPHTPPLRMERLQGGLPGAFPRPTPPSSQPGPAAEVLQPLSSLAASSGLTSPTSASCWGPRAGRGAAGGGSGERDAPSLSGCGPVLGLQPGEGGPG